MDTHNKPYRPTCRLMLTIEDPDAGDDRWDPVVATLLESYAAALRNGRAGRRSVEHFTVGTVRMTAAVTDVCEEPATELALSRPLP